MSIQFQPSEFDAERLDSVAEGYMKAIKNGYKKEAEQFLKALKDWDVGWAKEGEQ